MKRNSKFHFATSRRLVISLKAKIHTNVKGNSKCQMEYFLKVSAKFTYANEIPHGSNIANFISLKTKKSPKHERKKHIFIYKHQFLILMHQPLTPKIPRLIFKNKKTTTYRCGSYLGLRLFSVCPNR